MKSAIFLLVVTLGVVLAAKDMMRKSIVFDKDTPDVFYCPIHKPSGFDKLIVKARPLKKLCEFEGEPLPEDYKSDCYQDVDESDYACKEKFRIMMRMKPPGSEEPFKSSGRLARFIDVDKEFYVGKMGGHQQQQLPAPPLPPQAQQRRRKVMVEKRRRKVVRLGNRLNRN